MNVKVSIDKKEGTLTISDHGIGMTAEEIDKYINQIAFSGAEEFLNKYKNDANAIIGHFGLGFYSSFMVAKKVEIRTLSYQENAKPVMWSCDGSPEYTMSEIDKKERGTDIVLYIDDENKEFLEDSKIESLLKKYCRFLPVPVIFGKEQEWKDGKYVDTDKDKIINDTTPAWTKKPTELTEEDLTDGNIDILTMLVKSGLTASKSEARRAVQQGGVSVDGEKVTDVFQTFAGEALSGEGVVLKKGKKNFRKVLVK